MQTEPEVRAADDARIFLGLQPPRPELNAAGRQPGEPPFELHASRTVAGHQDDKVREAASRRRRLPPANAILEPSDGVNHHVEVLILSPARRTHDETAHAEPDSQTSKQSLTELLALHAIERHEDRRRAVVQHMHLADAEAIFDERGHASRHGEIGIGDPRVTSLVPSCEPHDRVPPPEAQREHGISKIVPVDDESNFTSLERKPRDRQRRKRRRVLHQDQIRASERPQLSPESIAESHGVEDGDDGVTDGRRLAKATRCGCQAVNRDAWMLGDRTRQRRALISDKIDAAAVLAYARAWYCIRALRPRSASASTTARMVGLIVRRSNYS